MIWSGIIKRKGQFFYLVVGFIALVLVVSWILKIRNIRRIKGDIVQLETKLSRGQEAWKNYPPLTPREREDLQKAQERLFRILPKEKDVPSVLQEIARVARGYQLNNFSLSTADGAAQPPAGQPPTPVSASPPVVVSQPTPATAPKAPESSGNIDSFPIRVSFAGDYQEIAYFLEALQKIPKLITIQSIQLQRNVPLIMAQVVLNAYYQKGDLPVKGK